MPGSPEYLRVHGETIASVAVAGIPPVLFILWQCLSWFIHDWHWLIVLVVLLLLGMLSGGSDEGGMIVCSIAAIAVTMWLGWQAVHWLHDEWRWAWLLAAFAVVPLVSLTVLTIWEGSLSFHKVKQLLGLEGKFLELHGQEESLTALATGGYLVFTAAFLLDGMTFALAVTFPAWCLWTAMTAFFVRDGAVPTNDADPLGDPA